MALALVLVAVLPSSAEAQRKERDKSPRAGQRRRPRLSRTRAFLEQRQGLYHSAVHLALKMNRPDEALAIAERSRSRAFLDLLGNATLSKGRIGRRRFRSSKGR